MKQSDPISPLFHTGESPQSSPPPARPVFGFLLGGTTLGIFFGCLLLCAGAGPASVILILLSTLGAFTGGILESFWPKEKESHRRPRQGRYHDISVSPFRDDRNFAPIPERPTRSKSHRECDRCGEAFEPRITCPMCGHSEKP